MDTNLNFMRHSLNKTVAYLNVDVGLEIAHHGGNLGCGEGLREGRLIAHTYRAGRVSVEAPWLSANTIRHCIQ
jgi:hypothetical protein